MGIYLNPNNVAFKENREKDIYVDKSLRIRQLEIIIQKDSS